MRHSSCRECCSWRTRSRPHSGWSRWNCSRRDTHDTWMKGSRSSSGSCWSSRMHCSISCMCRSSSWDSGKWTMKGSSHHKRCRSSCNCLVWSSCWPHSRCCKWRRSRRDSSECECCNCWWTQRLELPQQRGPPRCPQRQ